MPQAQQGFRITDSAQLEDGVVTSAKIALDTILAADVAPNAIGDSEIAAHTTTKITVPFSLVTGTVPIAQGGSGATTALAAFNALSPLTAAGDLLTRDATNNIRLALGAALTNLRVNAAATALEYALPSVSRKTGVATRAGDAASGNQTIAHGLGATPTYVRITALKRGGANNIGMSESYGAYDGTNTRCVFIAFGNPDATAETSGGNSTVNVLTINELTGSANQVATITVDGTNITLAWTLTGAPNSATIQILWEVFA